MKSSIESNQCLPMQSQSSDREQMESVWRQRAARLSRRTAPSGGEKSGVQVMVLGIGDERYGIELTGVVEIFPPVCCTPVPGAPAALAGVINVHGEIRPVIDFRLMLGIPQASASGTPTPVILLRRQGRQMGIKADRVEQILTVTREELRSTGEGQTSLPTRYIKALTHDTLMLLNVDALFAELSVEEESAL